MPIHRGKSAAFLVKRRFWELNTNGQRRYLESWSTVFRCHYKDAAIKRADAESALHGQFEVSVWHRGRRVWPVEGVK